MNNIKRATTIAVLTAAFSLAATAAFATTIVDNAKIYSGTCGAAGVSYCSITTHTWGKSVFTGVKSFRIDKNALVVDCTSFGVPRDATVSNTYLQALRANNANVTFVFDRPVGYRDTITCR